MKNWISFLFMFLFTLSIAFGQTDKPQTATTEKVAKPGQATTDDFNTLITELYKAWNTMNPDLVGKFYAKDPDLIFFDVAPLQYKGWKEYHDGVKQVFATFSSFKIVPDTNIHVTRKGKVAWTVLKFHMSAKEKSGTAIEADGRYTAIWEKRKGNWLIVHDHASMPLPEAPAK